MNVEEIQTALRSLRSQTDHLYVIMNKMQYDIGAAVRDESDRLSRGQNKLVKELKEQNKILKNELRLTKQSKKIMAFLSGEEDA